MAKVKKESKKEQEQMEAVATQPATKDDKKAKPKKWVKFRHKVVFAVLRFLFRISTKIKYNYTPVKSKIKGPVLLLSNHTATMDPFLMALSFKFPVYYFASDDLFTKGLASKIISFLVAPIPKAKSAADMQSIKTSIKILREGGAVGLFPEGNRTLTGKPWPIDISTAKYVKMTKVPLVLYNIYGGYGADPRWGDKIRRGKVVGGVKRIIEPSEYKDMTNEQLLAVIKKELAVTELMYGLEFKTRCPANYLERVLYACPNCNSFGTIVSKKKLVVCTECKHSANFSYGLTFYHGKKNNILPRTVSKWNDVQKVLLRQKVAEIPEDEIIFEDKNIELCENIRGEELKVLFKGDIIATKETLSIKGKDEEMTFRWEELSAVLLVGKRKLGFYNNHRSFQVRGDKNRACWFKYFELNRILEENRV